ncbi:MAG: ATP-binding protein [Victivallales bacterium]|nr:ATP-binding protein [Victivallales bacterium]
MKVSATHDDWSEIICCGLENQQIDFKSHQNWDTIGRVGRAKFARHAMALANTRGGYVVIGVSEDENGNPTDYIGMTEEEASSFDPSNVGQTINTFADPPVSIDIVRPVLDGKRYVVLVVYPFKDIPHVCSENCEHELQRGAFYIRTPDARSKVAVKSSELHLLIQRALRNQRQMLGRMLRGILYEDRLTDTGDNELLPPLLERSRRQASEKLGRSKLRSLPHFETICHPGVFFSELRLSDLRRVIDSLERPAINDLPWGLPLAQTEIYATNESLCGIQTVNGTAIVFWELYCNGLFYQVALLPGNTSQTRVIQAPDLAQATVFTLAMLGQLYSQLNHPDALLDITLRIPNSENAQLENIPSLDSNVPHICRIMDIEVKRQRSAADLEGGAATETATHFFAELCERFNATLDKADITELRIKLNNIL